MSRQLSLFPDEPKKLPKNFERANREINEMNARFLAQVRKNEAKRLTNIKTR